MTQRPPQAPSPERVEDDEEDIGAEVRRTLAELSPWAISVAVHLLLVATAVFLVWSTVLQQKDEPWHGQAAIHPENTIQPVQDQQPEQDADQAARTPTAPILPNDPVPSPIVPNIGSQQPHIPSPDSNPGPWNPNADRDGPGNPTSRILGPTGRQTVFVIDASGSLIDTFPLVVNELKRLLHQLAHAERERAANPAHRRQQPYTYAVVFFRDGEVLVQDRRGLRTAEPEQVARSVAWLDTVHPGGSTSPLPAIEQALAYHPDTVVILSDNITGHGLYELNADDLVGRVLQLRGDRRITVNTVQFLYPDPLERHGQPGTLRRLAEETGGAYRFVTDSELHLR